MKNVDKNQDSIAPTQTRKNVVKTTSVQARRRRKKKEKITILQALRGNVKKLKQNRITIDPPYTPKMR